MWEGLGGPVHMDQPDFTNIDPTLADCCRQEEESRKVRHVVESTLRRHDVVAMAERRRRHLVRNEYLEGCRCGYDPDRDGGEYPMLMEYRRLRQQQQQENERNANEKGDEDDDEDYKDPSDQQVDIPNHVKNDDNNNKVDGNDENKSNNNDEDDNIDDEFDYLLDEELPESSSAANALKEMEDRRRAELEWTMLHHQVAKQHGYGVHRQMHPTRVLKAAGLSLDNNKQRQPYSTGRAPPAAVVLHLFHPDSGASASLDYYLEHELAPHARGVKFMRSGGRNTLLLNAETVSNMTALSRLDPEHDLPALVAIRDGKITNICRQLQGLVVEDDDHRAVIVPDAVYNWLDRSGVLLTQPPPLSIDQLCAIRPEEEALLDHMHASANNNTNNKKNFLLDDVEFFRCGVPGCNKVYRHEHVGIQTTEQDGHVLSKEDVVGSTTISSAMKK